MGRLVEISIALLALAVTLPLLLIIAVAIKFESRGPILVGQPCLSPDGRRFRSLRFRTIPWDRSRGSRAWSPEMTRVGQFLWTTRIDALPQLINVIRGEIGLINDDAVPTFFVDAQQPYGSQRRRRGGLD
jgi:lipopolysaccharide/colanic/teichoic acid biosynthesis glycosyltransferase